MKYSKSMIRALWQSIARNLVTKSLALPMAFAVSILLARLMGPENFGHYSILLSLATVLASGVIRAQSVILVREVAGALTLNRYSKIWGAAILALLCGLLLILFIWLVDFFKLYNGDNLPDYLIQIVLLLLIVSFIGSFLRGLDFTASGLFVEQAIRPIAMCGFLFIFWILLYEGENQSLDFGILSLIFGLFIAIIIGSLLLLVSIKVIPFKKPEIEMKWIRLSLPLLLVLGYCLGLSSQLPILLMGLYVESVEIANYRVAESIAGLIGIALLAANVALGPKLATSIAEGDKEKFEHLLRFTSTVVVLIAIPLCLIFITTGGYLIPILYGDEYREATDLLWMLCLGQLINCFCGPVMLAINMLKKELYNLGAIFFSLSVTTISGLFLIPSYGAFGAACTATIGFFSWNICLLAMLYRFEGINSLPYFMRVGFKWK